MEKYFLKLLLFIFQGFSNLGFVLLAWNNPEMIALMCYCWFSSTIILALSLFYVFGGVKALKGWYAKQMMKAHQRALEKRATKDYIESHRRLHKN